MLKNFSGNTQCIRASHYFSFSGNSCYINILAERPQHAVAIDHMFAISNFQNVIVTYEDVPDSYLTDFSLGYQRVVIGRDIVNVIASGLKMLENSRIQGKTGKTLVDINDTTFATWMRLSGAHKRGMSID